MDPDELASLVTDRTRLVILNSPHNPCGSGLAQDDVEAIAEVAIERDLVVLSDEVYWAVRYGGGPPERAVGRRHGRADGAAGRLVQDLRHDRLAARLRGPARAPGRARDPAGRQLRLLHGRLQPARRRRRPRGPWAPVEAMVASLRERRDLVVAGLNAIDGITCQAGRRLLRLPPGRRPGPARGRAGRWLLADAGVALLPGTAFGARRGLPAPVGTPAERLREGLDGSGGSRRPASSRLTP